ncbi:peptidase [Streptomyces sp. NPDC005438]|uniref:trypsin-like serine peptidase n=1 Tax=Streptomyces sp. NPDC005438 TaxID=3156880 RepID=UPI0033A1B345
MRRTRRQLALGALVSTAALLITGVQASPSGAATSEAPSVHQQRTDKDLRSFWTAERMRNATPLDITADPSELSDSVKRGAERTVPSTGAKDTSPTSFPQVGGPWDGGGKVTTTVGRVFFTYDGRQASCSGNAVTSDNGSTVLTAGHCVKMDGAWHTDWIFVPGYHDGEAPHGKWSASETLTTPQWDADQNAMDYDVGAAVVDPLDGKKLTDVVGGQGVAFNGEYEQDMYSFGYPAADPYDGESLTYCSATSGKDFLLTQDHSLACNMTGGSSGGPWFLDFDESTGEGVQASVNSFGYVFLPDTMFGPYFGAEAEELYDRASTS